MKKVIVAIKKWLQGVDWKGIEQKIKKLNWRRVGVGAAIVALTLIVVSVWNLERQGYIGPTNVSGTAANTPAQSVDQFRHPLTGVLVAEQIERPNVYAVMVENSADAWPQSGVDQAFEVIEAPAEGGIPRWLALFAADKQVEAVGPVRSARPYFIEWASAYGALYAHVGGSPAALNLLADTNMVLDFNEFANQYQFWRSPDWVAPHNVYTSTELLEKGLVKRYPDGPLPSYQTYLFKDDVGLGVRPAVVDDVVVDMGASLYRVVWKYDAASNSYLRYRNTTAHTMSDGATLTANNIAVIATDMTVLDAIGRLQIATLGQGEGLLIQDGMVKNITWKKPTAGDIIRFYDANGEELALNAGKTWIEVVESLDQVKY